MDARYKNGFAIGPSIVRGQEKTFELFAPTIQVRSSEARYKMIVFTSNKIVIALFYDEDYTPDFEFFSELHECLSDQTKMLANVLAPNIARVTTQDDAVRFFYFNEMNLAVKFSNKLSKDIFTTEFKHHLNYIHKLFK